MGRIAVVLVTLICAPSRTPKSAETRAMKPDYTQNALMWECRGGFHDAGQIGGISRFPTRRPDRSPFQP
jgi:hypothetical protein